MALVMTALPASAMAQTANADAVAEGLFREGKRLLAAGQIDEACAKLAESDRLVPALGTLLNLALCFDKQGKTASAWSAFASASSRAARTSQPARARFAQGQADRLEKTLSRVSVQVPAPVAGLVVRFDGKELGSGAWGSPVPVDPGVHTVEASAPQRKAWSQKITVEQGPGQSIVQVPELQSALPPSAPAVAAVVPQPAPAPQPAASPPPPPAAVAAPSDAPPPLRSDTPGRRAVGYTLGGVGVVAAGVGTVFGVIALDRVNTAKSDCPGGAGAPCTTLRGYDASSDAHWASGIATASFGLAIATLGVGAYLLLTGQGPDAADSKARGLSTLFVAPGRAGIEGRW